MSTTFLTISARYHCRPSAANNGCMADCVRPCPSLSLPHRTLLWQTAALSSPPEADLSWHPSPLRTQLECLLIYLSLLGHHEDVLETVLHDRQMEGHGEVPGAGDEVHDEVPGAGDALENTQVVHFQPWAVQSWRREPLHTRVKHQAQGEYHQWV